MSHFPPGILITFYVTLCTKQTVFCHSDSGYFFEIVNRYFAVYILVPVFNILSNAKYFFIYCKLVLMAVIRA